MVPNLIADILIESGDVLVLMVVGLGIWCSHWVLGKRVQTLEDQVRSLNEIDGRD